MIGKQRELAVKPSKRQVGDIIVLRSEASLARDWIEGAGEDRFGHRHRDDDPAAEAGWG